MSNTPPRVPPRILSKLAVYVPPVELVDAYLEEIARGYNVQWTAPVRNAPGVEAENEVAAAGVVEEEGAKVGRGTCLCSAPRLIRAISSRR